MRLTLADIEAEKGDIEPFEFEIDPGHVVTLPHPEDMPFQVLVGFDALNPSGVLRALMGDETFDLFVQDERVTLRVLNVILQAYYKHYGLGSPGEGSGSQPSSIGSARASKRASRAKATA